MYKNSITFVYYKFKKRVLSRNGVAQNQIKYVYNNC